MRWWRRIAVNLGVGSSAILAGCTSTPSPYDLANDMRTPISSSNTPDYQPGVVSQSHLIVPQKKNPDAIKDLVETAIPPTITVHQDDPLITRAEYQEKPKRPNSRSRIEVPPDLPGADAPPLQVPELKGLSNEERIKKLREVFPKLLEVPEFPRGALPSSGKPWTLEDTQQMALERSPVVLRAKADVEAAYGMMIQSGLYPNPMMGYQADQIQPGNGPKNNAGQQGMFLQQLIKTAGKLELSRAVAGIDYLNASVALRRAQMDVLSSVRLAWFNLIVAEESMRDLYAIVKLSKEVYDMQIRLVGTGDAAQYEPMQLYAQAVIASTNYIDARNRWIGSWKQLAAAIGDLSIQPMQITRLTEINVPQYDRQDALRRILENHTDVTTARNTVIQAQYQLRLAQVTPIPDIYLGTAFQHDNSVGNNQMNLQVGMQIPIFNRNQGAIRAAQATIDRSIADVYARRNDLAGRLAEAYARYQTSQIVVKNYRDNSLPNLTRAYRLIYARHQEEPTKIGFNDIIVAQQNLAQGLSAYLAALTAQWQAVIDVSNLLQIDNIYQPLVNILPPPHKAKK